MLPVSSSYPYSYTTSLYLQMAPNWMQWEFAGSRVTPFGALRLLTGYPWPLRYFKAKAPF